jgi:lipopolysaccharide transport system ATP-binding protein
MNNVAIHVEGLSKRYRIGELQRYKALRDTLTNVLYTPFRVAASVLKGKPPISRHQSDNYIWALKEVSFEVKQSEVIGIIGRNGAGKSTLLKILSRITEPTEGYARVQGRVGSLLEVGTGFHPELTGRENIFLNGSILGMRKAEIKHKFDEIVSFAEVEKFIDTPVKHYSSGMYVRLAFAVAAHLEPEILLVDEVLAVGDTQFQKKCLGKMGDVAKEGRTVLFVSHNMTAVQRLCENALWLERGQIRDIGEANNVVSSYLQMGMYSVMEKLWDNPSNAPGNEKVRLRRVCVKPLNQVQGEPITVETALQLEFEFWNNLPGAALNFSIHLHTVEGTAVFAVASDCSPRPKGIVRGSFQIPPHFLNDGVYGVIIMIIQDRSLALYQLSDTLVFEVHDAGRSGNWFGKWPGVVRPQFDFITENITL